LKENIEIRKQLLESVEMLSDEQLNRKASDDSWSIVQVLDHLYLMESKLVKLMTRTVKEPPGELTPDKPIHLTIDRSRKFNAPAHFIPSNEFTSLDEMKQKLNHSRNSLIEFVEQTKDLNLVDKGMPHPVFGQINLKQWVPFIGLHEKRHLEQINEIKKTLK